MTYPLGILGGTFNPIHLGHLKIANYLLNEMNLAEIKFIPCFQPVHRKIPEVTPEQRVAMVDIAIKNLPNCTLDLREIHRSSPSYTIQTLDSLRNEYPKTPLCLILGLDAFLKINTWKAWTHLLNYAHFVVINRPNNMKKNGEVLELLNEHQTKDIKDIYNNIAGKILLLEMEPIRISATDIRQRLHKGLPVDDLLPPGVLKYIRQQQLYTDKAS